MKNEQLYGKAVDYIEMLRMEERSVQTQRQYYREILRFLDGLEGQALTKEAVLHYKQGLEKRYKSASVNAKLCAVNGFLDFLGREDLRLRLLRIQPRAYQQTSRELSKGEYIRLIRMAERQKNRKLSLLIQTICSTGIRVSELSFITVESLYTGEAMIRLKGKNRMLLLPSKLCSALRSYARQQGIRKGAIFITRTGKNMDRSNIWRMMKKLCLDAGVEMTKVFPHNLRHLFARTFYEVDRDIAKLADILGHSSINTTRIYLMTACSEHRRKLDRLGLIPL